MCYEKPIILINFKTCKEGSGDCAEALARRIDHIQKSIDEFEIILALQAQDIYRIRQQTNLRIFSQHVDPIYYGGKTGHICPEAIKDAGACGTLLNHPDKKIEEGTVRRTIEIARHVGLDVILCATDVREGINLSKYDPDYIGIEAVELIGSEHSLPEAHPEIISEALLHIKNKLLFGAGIKSREDICQVINQGGMGVMISSAILKADDPEEALISLTCDTTALDTTVLLEREVGAF